MYTMRLYHLWHQSQVRFSDVTLDRVARWAGPTRPLEKESPGRGPQATRILGHGGKS